MSLYPALSHRLLQSLRNRQLHARTHGCRLDTCAYWRISRSRPLERSAGDKTHSLFRSPNPQNCPQIDPDIATWHRGYSRCEMSRPIAAGDRRHKTTIRHRIEREPNTPSLGGPDRGSLLSFLFLPILAKKAAVRALLLKILVRSLGV